MALGQLKTKSKPIESGNVVLKYKETRGKDGKIYPKYRGSFQCNGRSIAISIDVTSGDQVLAKPDRNKPEQKVMFASVAVFPIDPNYKR